MGGLGGAQSTAFIQLPWKPLSKPVSDPEERKGGGVDYLCGDFG